MNGIKESDWKKFRKLEEVALDRFCQKVLVDVQRVVSDVSKTSHVRYGETYGLIQTRNKLMARLFDGTSRSVALQRLVDLRRERLITDDELSPFSQECQEYVQRVLSVS